MPEGHTIHRLARDLRRDLAGAHVAASSPQGRMHQGAARLDGERLGRTSAHGKHLFLEWDSGDTLHVHLGLIGKFVRRPQPVPEPVGQVRLRLVGEEAGWDLSGPAVCRVGPTALASEVTATLGPDPLRRDGRPAEFVERLSRRRVPVGAALLDQLVIAGIGNVYRAELLFLSGIHPLRPASALSAAEATDLWELAAAQLRTGVRLDRIVTVDPADVGASAPGRIRPGDRLYVYKRRGRPCRRCGTPVERSAVANRKIWFCPRCQLD